MRETRQQLRAQREGRKAEKALTDAIEAIRDLDIPHLAPDEPVEGEIIH